MKYKELILNKLIDKYERSSQSYDLNVKKRAISLSVEKDSIFRKYWAVDHYLYRSEIEREVQSIETEGYIKVIYENELLKTISLNVDRVDDIYLYLKREAKKEKGLKELSFIEFKLKQIDAGSVAYVFLSKMQHLLKEHSSHEKYFKSIEDLKLLLAMIKAIEENDEEILLRNFSKKHFKDSKLLEKYASKILSLFNEFDAFQYVSFFELCAKHYINKHSGYAYIKKGVVLKINEQVIDLDKLATDLALSDNAIDEMNILQVNASKVYTIENLTTYHYFNDNDSIVIYLGGYHNHTRRNLLKKLQAAKTDLRWFHIGDIDWGGFEIFLHLTSQTGIDFQPYLMGIDELEKYEAECLPLTPNDRIRLKNLLTDSRAKLFYPVIKYMLVKGYKLEQESLVFDC